MGKLEQFEVDGQTIWVETQALEIASSTGAVGDDEFAPTSSRPLEALKKVDLAATLNAVLGPIQSALKSVKPDEVNLELSLGFKAGAGVFVASGEGNAQLKLTLKWKPAN